MPWDKKTIDEYHEYAKKYISTYDRKIDCADLAIASLVDFSGPRKLPLRFKYYSDGWKWLNFNPNDDDAKKFRDKATMMLGALNVIDNTKPVAVGSAKPGDLIMTRWSSRLGHTRVIYSVRLNSATKKYEITWYQGNLPPVVPEKREASFSDISNVFGGTPRRWKFEQFDD